MHIIGDDLNTIYQEMIGSVYCEPEYISSPRGQATRECLAATITLRNPRARIITSQHRKVNYGFAVGEFTWYWMGREDLEYIAQYNSRLTNFSDNGKTLNSAYGRRIFGRERSFSQPLGQWRVALEKLREDPDTRQAVIRILRPEDLKEETKDVPCTCTLQFFIRDGRLHMHTSMRSNDVFWGVPYDFFSFTMMQECMALELGVELGSYHHTAGSLHIYERHFKDSETIIGETQLSSEPMPAIEGLESLWRVCNVHPYLARGEEVPESLRVTPGTAEDWMMDKLVTHWAKRNAK